MSTSDSITHTRMSTKSVVAVVFCIAWCAHHDSLARPTDEFTRFIRKCCFRGADTIVQQRIRCSTYEDANDSSIVTSYDSLANVSAIPCCASCLQKTFESEESTEGAEADRAYISKSGATAATTSLSCPDGCLLNAQPSQEESDTDNHTFLGIDESHGNDSERRRCDSVFTSLKFWGSNMVIFANLIYILPYLVVLIVYVAVPGLSSRAYSKAVVCYNAWQIVLNGIIIGMGFSILCHARIPSIVYSLLGLALMFLTISSTCWLFAICIDITLVITRFRWMPASDSSHQEERKKFFTYTAWTFTASLLPTTIAAVAELSPFLPKSSPVRPNFGIFEEGANLSVIVYVASIPALICLANSVLFCYTSYKMIRIQKSTKLATANSTMKVNLAKKRYFLFLKLYLLMDTPWFTSILAAVFTDLWLLKFLRMIQPILMLVVILPPGTITRAYTRVCSCQNLKRPLTVHPTP